MSSGQCGRENSHANFRDLENSVPPEESNEYLFDQAWDDHIAVSVDAKKVKEARQLEMGHYNEMLNAGRIQARRS